MSSSDAKRRILIVGIACVLLTAAIIGEIVYRGANSSQANSTQTHPSSSVQVNTGYTISFDFNASGVFWKPYQQKIFNAQGLWWAFYSNGSYEVMSTSVDGANWTKPVVADTIEGGTLTSSDVSVWNQGSYVYNIVSPWSNSLWFKRGILNSNGTVTWGNETDILNGAYIIHPYVIVDSNGDPWVSYAEQMSNGTMYPYVVRDSMNDGSWVTASGFPYCLSSVSATSLGGSMDYGVMLQPLTDGAVYTFYVSTQRSNGFGQTQVWDGTSWLPAVNTTAVIGGEWSGSWEWDAVALDDSVNLIYLQNGTCYIAYEKYTFATNSYGPEEVVWSKSEEPFTCPMVSVDPATGDVYAVWWDTNQVGPLMHFGDNPWSWYSVLHDGVWSSAQIFVNDSLGLGSVAMVSGYSGSLSAYVYNNRLGMIYVNGTSYYEAAAMPVRFSQIETNP